MPFCHILFHIFITNKSLTRCQRCIKQVVPNFPSILIFLVYHFSSPAIIPIVQLLAPYVELQGLKYLAKDIQENVNVKEI